MCHAHAKPATVKQLAPEVLELTIAQDEWRRSRTRDERIWSNGPILVVLTTERRIEIQVGLLKPYAVRIRQRCDYLETKKLAIQLARNLESAVAERTRMLTNFYYAADRAEAERQSRLYLLDFESPIELVYEQLGLVEQKLENGPERQILACISQALANCIF